MATFTAVVSDPETGRSYQVDVDGQDGNRFVGREIGDSVDGDAVGLPGYTVEITGGSDAAGRPLHNDVGGSDLAEVLLAEGPGYRPTKDGERRRVTVRGREIGEETVQLNLRIGDRGEDHVEVLLGDADPEDFADEEDETEADEETQEPDAEESEEAESEAEEADEEEAEEGSPDTDEEQAEVDETEETETEDDEAAEATEDTESGAETATEDTADEEAAEAEAAEDADSEGADDDTEPAASEDGSDEDEDDEE